MSKKLLLFVLPIFLSSSALEIERLYKISNDSFVNGGYIVYKNSIVIPYEHYKNLPKQNQQGLKDALIFVKATLLEDIRIDEFGGLSAKTLEGINMRFPWVYYENLKNFDKTLPIFAICKLRRFFDCEPLGI